MLTYDTLQRIITLPAADERDAAIAGVAGAIADVLRDAGCNTVGWHLEDYDPMTCAEQAIAAAEAMRDRSGMVWTFALVQCALFWRAMGSRWREVLVDVEHQSFTIALSLAVALAILKEKENGDNV